jgi:hypothetical protein
MLRPVTGPDIQWKAAAFARWHEPDDARVSSPVQARGEILRAYSAKPAVISALTSRPIHVSDPTWWGASAVRDPANLVGAGNHGRGMSVSA